MKRKRPRNLPGFLGLGRLSRRKQGAALVLTLIVVSMLTILVMAYFVTMSVEMRAAHAYSDSQRAKMLAQGAVAHGISLLRENIPDPAPISDSAGTARALNWAVNPGRLAVFDARGGVEFTDLHTGRAEVDPDQTNDPDVHSVDLNEPLPGKQYPAIAMALDESGLPDPAADIPPMRIEWIPMLQNPAEEASAENPITGRYAFWMDDESARINFNVALGKPARSDSDPQFFWEQYDLGLMTPLFTSGRGDVEYNSGSKDREWALGKLRSINLDVLFEKPAHLDENGLLGHAWLRGFSRYPEAILDFVEMEEAERREWYHGNKFNLTFYSRAPEFNAFGRSRLFTTNIPLSLEAGPLYQLPFVYNGPGVPETDYQIEGVLHLHSLMGSLGFTHQMNDAAQGKVHAANIVNRAQFEMLKRYMTRRWPGYGGSSFVDKYGEKECYQMALTMLTMARMATTTMNTGGGGASSRDWAWRTTSVIYSPHNTERPGANPERHYWQIDLEVPDAQGRTRVPMLPEMPGPHITEVRLIMFPERVGRNRNQYRIRYRYEVEYYQNDMGPVLRVNYFPTKVDYFDLEAKHAGSVVARHEFGPPEPGRAAESRADRNWNHGPSLGRFRTAVANSVRIGSRGSGFPNRRIVSSPTLSIGGNERAVPNDGEEKIFDASKGEVVEVSVNWRLGMGVSPDARRPRQMIPLGETSEDVLDATFQIDLRGGDKEIVSWQINDPRLSWDRAQWVRGGEGTPGQRNTSEPEDDATEKSKFRYFQRGPGRVKDPDKPRSRSFPLNRPDEYNSRSRISSKGYWSVLHTGIQNLVPWRSLELGSGQGNMNNPPDFLLLDLLGATYPMQHDQWRINSTLPDEFSTVSFMNSTAGQINLNSRIYPEENEFFQPPQRRKPLEAVFKHLRSDGDVDRLIRGIEDQQKNDFFRYIGELSLVDGYRRSDAEATRFENEELLRNMAGCLTTKSNTFGLWGVSQVVKKIGSNEEWGTFEDGDVVLGEKRFYAVIERYVWPGKDGVPGNGHLNAQGVWDRVADQQQETHNWSGNTTDTLYQLPGSPPMRKGGGNRLSLDLSGTYPWYDGPHQVEMDKYASRTLGKVKWSHSSLENAYNPPQPVIKYRVAYFRYLDE